MWRMKRDKLRMRFLIMLLFIVFIMTILIVTGCARHIRDTNENEATITVDLRIDVDKENSLMAESVDRLMDSFNGWKTAHPEIVVAERKRITNNDFTALGVLGADHMPDVFITNSLAGQALANAGLVMDLTDYIETEISNTEFADTDLKTFRYGKGVYALPVFYEAVSVIIYDTHAWKKGEPVMCLTDDGEYIEANFLSAVLSDKDSKDWLQHMVDGDRKASFTDGLFVERLEKMMNGLEEISSNEKKEYSDADELIKEFSAGRCLAVCLNGDDVFKLLSEVKENDLSLYNRIGFETLCEDAIPRGYSYGLFLNVSLKNAENKKKLEACLEMCNAIIQEQDPKAYEVVYRNDAILARLEEVKASRESTMIVNQHFSPSFWEAATNGCFADILTEKRTAAEYASALQNYYEQYYLNVEDYSTNLNQYVN